MAGGRPYFPSLDGLRCLAILPIVWHHSLTRAEDGALGRGPLGVDLFFVVSGFLITTLLLDERRSAPVDLRAFWTRRSLRIFPLYYLVLGVFVVHALFVRPPGPVRTHFLASLPFYATYTSNVLSLGPVDHPIVFAFAWSLAAEEQFYALWPPVLRLARGVALPACLMGGLVLLDQGAERGWLGPLLGEGLALRIVRSFATPIGLGALLALASEHALVRRTLGQRWTSAAALAALAAAVIQPWAVLPTQLVMTALVAGCALRRDHLLAPLLENAAVRHVGIVSYGIYLLNIPVVTATRAILGRDAGAPLVFVVATLGSVAVASATHRWIERPFLRLRDRYRPGSARPKSRQRIFEPPLG